MKETTKSLLAGIIKGRKYFSVRAVKSGLKEREPRVNPKTINQYLYDLKTRGRLVGAGRGWYSTIAPEYKLQAGAVEELGRGIHRKYPLLSFSLWTTRQLQPYAHHLMMTFVTLVYTDFDAMHSVSEFLKSEGYRSFLNPRGLEVEKYFDASSDSVVVRPLITREPRVGYFAAIEKILVDSFVEKDRLHLMDGREYQRILFNLILSNRINMARLFEYAERRKVEEALLDTIDGANNGTILCETRPAK